MSFGNPKPSAPSARITIDRAAGGCQYVLTHRGGDDLATRHLDITHSSSADPFNQTTLQTGDTVTFDPTESSVTVLWRSSEGETTHSLAEFSVDPDPPACMYGAFYAVSGGDLVSFGAGDSVVDTFSGPSNVAAIGPGKADVTGDGKTDIPYVTDTGKLKITNATNGTTVLADDGDIPGNIETSKTRLAVGSWNGSPTSVFFVDENHDQIYRVTGDGSVTEVANPGNGAQAVVGPGDIDGDGDDELIFADASQQLRYVDDDGTLDKVNNGQTGSNNGIGAGAIADFDDDGVVRVAVVDGSNDIKLTGEPVAAGGEGTTTITAADAKKAPVAVADVDDDGTDEIVYVGKSTGNIKYVDDVGGSNTIKTLTDADGNTISGSDETGVA